MVEESGVVVPAVVRKESAFFRDDGEEAILIGLFGRRVDDSLLGSSMSDLR